MGKFDVIVADNPWSFSDKLTMADVARGAEANYNVLNIDALKQLKVKEIASDDSVLALWVPSSLLQEGLDIMNAWGFRQTQTHIWVKVKQRPFIKILTKSLKTFLKQSSLANLKELVTILNQEISFDEALSFGMGRLFRQTHEICLIGVRGKIYAKLKNRSQRSVHFGINLKHSAKPETLQERLELMFPNSKRLEMFARRQRANWTCIGNQAPQTMNEDIRDSLDRLIKQM